MGLEERLREDLKQAIREGETVRRDVLRFLLAKIKNAEIEKRAPLDEGDILSLISREVKLRQESIEAFKKGNRPDLVAQEEAQLAVLTAYLPRQLSREEIAELASQVIREVQARGLRDKGKVMGRLMPQVKGKAEGQMVSQVVDELLAKLAEA